jgi:hypothetical protein
VDGHGQILINYHINSFEGSPSGAEMKKNAKAKNGVTVFAFWA